MKKVLLPALLLAAATTGFAQRTTDLLDRGLVALPSGSGNFVSWRIFGEEYYDVEYNLYRDGVKVNSTPLKVSNYIDTGGKNSSQYQVAAVVRGVEQEKCAAVTRWNAGYLDIPVQPVINRNGADVTADYTLNDVSLGDVDGDGVTEFLVKRNSGTILDYSGNKHSFHRLECYNIKGDRLWYIDLGPNMVSGPDEQYDAVLYDWDMDGKAEVLMRGADNMIIHKADGATVEIGNMSLDTRNTLMSDANMAYTHTGAEYLLYLNGETGEPYVQMDYPLPRLESGETDLNAAWGDGYGHRSTKHFFGAPFLDGRKASIFLGRGAYTRHRMVAFDVNPATHELTERWRWASPNSGSWFGQGYHNYGIADVDWDGRDEIVFGSMVIDDNGKGLSTTGLGHGDAQHCSDFDPYRWGQEIFACNESSPANNYRNATTAKIYYRLQATGDDGRALCGNFTNEYPGSVGKSNGSGVISTVADKVLSNVPGFDLNFRIYWDGDLCEEILNSPGTEKEAKIDKIVGSSVNRIFTSSGCKMNNWTKNNPGATGDIIGDWREELVIRTGDNANLRIYTTSDATSYRIPTLWHDHQYRQGMVWQCLGYNQPPHTSFFLGELEGITVAPPPLTMTGRTEVANGGTISSAYADQHVIVCETNNTEIAIAEGANPYMVTFNVPSWVQGSTNNNQIVYDYYTCNVTGGALTGSMRLVKQGDGVLTLPAAEHTYTGETNVWAGTLNFDGKLPNSPLWLNRFAKLYSTNGVFRSIQMDYAAELHPGGDDSKGTVTANELILGFGSRIVIDLYNDGLSADYLKIGTLRTEKKDWTYGPEYLTPVIEFIPHLGGDAEMATGEYLIGEVASNQGVLADIKLEGLDNTKKNSLKLEDGKLYLVVGSVREAASVIWTAATDNIWNVAGTENFTLAGDATATPSVFVNQDKVLFDDSAANFNVSIEADVEADTLLVDNTKAYTFSGAGSITGNTVLVKRGTGMLTVNLDNDYTGGTRISGGTLRVSSLSNANQPKGHLGAVNTSAAKFVIENGAMLTTTAAVQMGSPIKFETAEGGIINNTQDFVVNRAFSGTKATKQGSGWMKLNVSNSSLDTLVIKAGTVQCISSPIPGKTVVYAGGALVENAGTSYNVHVMEGKTGTWTTANRSTYTNKVTGSGTLTIYCATEKGSNYYATRTPLKMDMSKFEGTIIPQATYAADGRFTLDTNTGLPKGTMNIPSGIIVQNSGKIYTIGKVTGKGSLGSGCTFSNGTSVGNNTWKVGNDEDFNWEGTVTGTGTAFTKIGSGKITMKGASDCTGTIRIEEGSLAVGTTTQLGTGILNVAEGGTLCGTTGTKNSLTNSRYTISGSVMVGLLETSFSGQINFGGKNVTFNDGSIYEVRMRSCATKSNTGGTSIQEIAKLTMNGTIRVRLYEDYTPAEGDSLLMWKEVETFEGTPKFELPELPQGYYWITERASEGVLTIGYNPEGIDAIAADEEVTVSVVNMSGVEVAGFICPKGAVEETFHKLSLDRGFYLLNLKSSTASGVMKLMKH